jgi:hypothetical protein
LEKLNAFASTLIATLSVCVAATATTVPRMNVKDLARSAGIVVHGRVVRHWLAWDTTHTFIWTHYAVQVEDRIKGEAADTTVISEPGGVLDGIGMKVEGVPEYRDGEEVVVFLHRTPIGYWRSYGLMQGKFTVIQDAGGQKRVRANLAGIETVGGLRSRQKMLRTEGTSIENVNGLPLGQFKQMIVREAVR